MKPRMRNAIKKSALCFGLACVITALLFGILCVGLVMLWTSDPYREAAPQPPGVPQPMESLQALFIVTILPLLGPIWAGIVLLACLTVNFYHSSSPPSQRMGHAIKKGVLCMAITLGAVTLLSSILVGIGWIKWPGREYGNGLDSFLYMLVNHGFRLIVHIWAGAAMLVFLVVGFYQSSSEEHDADGGAPS